MNTVVVTIVLDFCCNDSAATAKDLRLLTAVLVNLIYDRWKKLLKCYGRVVSILLQYYKTVSCSITIRFYVCFFM